jgi:predicted RNA-binding protein associated with RNAse of E/G family
VLNRKYADLRHSPRLDARLVRYEPEALPQAVLSLGPACARKVKGGVVLSEPGFTYALFLAPGRWYVVTSIFDRERQLVAHHVDIACPPEEEDGMLSFLDLKLDLILPVSGEAVWVDRDHYAEEVAAGTIPPEWQRRVEETVRELERARRERTFPPPEVRGFRPEPWP